MFCNQCKEELKDGAKFCPKCGLAVEEDLQEEAAVSNKKKIGMAAGIIFGILAVAAIVIVVLINGAKNDNLNRKEKEAEAKKENVKEEALEDEYMKEEVLEGEYIFPNSDKEYLTDAQVAPLTEEELGYARNEIMARRGRIYKGGQYEIYFSKKNWYKGTKDAKAFDANYENELNDIEKANVELLLKYERRLQAERIAGEYYASILEEYQNAEAEGYRNMEKYPHVNPLLFDYMGKQPIYYTLVDLCGDGIPELFIGQLNEELDPGYAILGMYGWSNGRTRTFSINRGGTSELVDSILGERNRYYICENLMVKNVGSGGAGYSGTIFYQMKENTAELYYVEGITQDMDKYYKSSVGVTEQPVSKDEYDSISNKYPVKEDMQWYRVAEFEQDEQEVKKSASSPEECYDDIIQQYRDNKGLLQTGGDEDFTVKYPNVNWNVFSNDGMIPDGLSYAMIDIDNNGTAELFIADVPDNAPEQYVVYGIFTCVDGKPAELFGNSDMGGLANFFVCDNGNVLKVENQADSAWLGNHYYRLKHGTADMEYVDGVWAFTGSSMGTMYERGEEFLADDSEEISKEECQKITEQNILKTDIAWEKI